MLERVRVELGANTCKPAVHPTSYLLGRNSCTKLLMAMERDTDGVPPPRALDRLVLARGVPRADGCCC
jgi:hypothetical protein